MSNQQNQSDNQINSPSKTLSNQPTSPRTPSSGTKRDANGHPINRSNSPANNQSPKRSSHKQSNSHPNSPSSKQPSNQSASPKQSNHQSSRSNKTIKHQPHSPSNGQSNERAPKRSPHPQSAIKSPYQQAAYQQIQLASPKGASSTRHSNQRPSTNVTTNPVITLSINNNTQNPHYHPQHDTNKPTEQQVNQVVRTQRKSAKLPTLSSMIIGQSLLDIARTCEKMTDEFFDEIEVACPLIAASVSCPSPEELERFSSVDRSDRLINGMKRLRPRSARVAAADAKHAVTVAEMGDYISYLKRAPRQLRTVDCSIDSSESSGTPFGSPYKLNRTRRLSKNKQSNNELTSSTTKLSTRPSLASSDASSPDAPELDDVREHDVVADPRRRYDRHTRPSFDEWRKQRATVSESSLSPASSETPKSESIVMVLE